MIPMTWIVKNRKGLLMGAFFLSLVLLGWHLYNRGFDAGVKQEQFKIAKAKEDADLKWTKILHEKEQEAINALNVSRGKVNELRKKLADVKMPDCPDAYAEYNRLRNDLICARWPSAECMADGGVPGPDSK